MNQFICFTKAKASVFWSSLVFLYLSFGTASAQGTNVFDTSKIVSKDSGDTFDAQIIYYVKLTAKLAIVAVMLFGAAKMITFLFSSFKQAQKDEEWGTFMIVVGMVFLALIVAALIANFAFGWIENLTI